MVDVTTFTDAKSYRNAVKQEADAVLQEEIFEEKAIKAIIEDLKALQGELVALEADVSALLYGKQEFNELTTLLRNAAEKAIRRQKAAELFAEYLRKHIEDPDLARADKLNRNNQVARIFAGLDFNEPDLRAVEAKLKEMYQHVNELKSLKVTANITIAEDIGAEIETLAKLQHHADTLKNHYGFA